RLCCPCPLCLATCGYGHSGRVRSTFPSMECDATSELGASPCSTHRSRGPILSNVVGPSPPPQWPIPGARNSRTLSDASAAREERLHVRIGGVHDQVLGTIAALHIAIEVERLPIPRVRRATRSRSVSLDERAARSP